MELDVKVLAAILSAVINLILIIFVSLHNRRHILYRSFLLICFCLFVWNIRVIVSRNFQVSDANPIYAILIMHIFYMSATACLYVLPVATLQFTAAFIGLESKYIFNAVRITYLTAFCLSIIYALEILSATAYDYILWMFTLPLFVASFLLIGRAYLRSQRPLERTRLAILLTAGSIGVTGAIAEDIMTASGVNVGGLGNIANAAYSLLVATCLFRHRLFDIQVTTRRTLSFALVTALLFAGSYLLSVILHPLIPLPYVYIFITALLLLLFARRLMISVEKILFGKSKYLSQTVDEIRYALDEARGINDLLRTSVDIVMENMGVNRCICIGRNEITGQYQYYWPPATDIDRMVKSRSFNDLTTWIARRHTDEPLVYDELLHTMRFGEQTQIDRRKIAQVIADMKTLGYEVYAPFALDNRFEGVMCLGEKTNGQVFTGSDIRFIKLLSYNCVLRFQHLKMLERMRQLEQLATLGEMAAYVAHEVKNPLTIIRSSAQIIESGNNDFKGSRIIIEECDRLNRVITRMLDFSKAAKPVPRCINIAEEVNKRSKEMIRSCESKQLKLSINCPSKYYRIRFDEDHLRQVLDNLLLNAIEAAPPDGEIDIKISEENSHIKVAISDNGPGISHLDKGDIYRPFYTTKPGGIGLGLPITNRLIELNCGSMSIESLPHRGCIVTLKLPKWRKEK
ncbi:MAG: ATP-binding protein [candidate division WOR-3 bacterium]|nr:ATP-binding protein [candidate division WOR-3 bacterium]